MTFEPRFLQAADNARPFGSHRYDVYGPKIGRMLTLFGQTALRAWTSLEADSSVIYYCERPIVITHVKPKRIIDFWVNRNHKDELWFLLRNSELSLNQFDIHKLQAFTQWSTANGFSAIFTNPDDFEDQETYFANWGAIIRYLSVNEKMIPPKLGDQLCELTQKTRTLAFIERNFPAQDPIVVRTALFSLIHQGKIRCIEINARPIGAESTFEMI